MKQKKITLLHPWLKTLSLHVITSKRWYPSRCRNYSYSKDNISILLEDERLQSPDYKLFYDNERYNEFNRCDSILTQPFVIIYEYHFVIYFLSLSNCIMYNVVQRESYSSIFCNTELSIPDSIHLFISHRTYNFYQKIYHFLYSTEQRNFMIFQMRYVYHNVTPKIHKR